MSKLEEVYDLTNKILGKGAFGFVHTAAIKHKKDTLVAIKTIQKKNMRADRGLLKNEINAL